MLICCRTMCARRHLIPNRGSFYGAISESAGDVWFKSQIMSSGIYGNCLLASDADFDPLSEDWFCFITVRVIKAFLCSCKQEYFKKAHFQKATWFLFFCRLLPNAINKGGLLHHTPKSLRYLLYVAAPWVFFFFFKCIALVFHTLMKSDLLTAETSHPFYTPPPPQVWNFLFAPEKKLSVTLQ